MDWVARIRDGDERMDGYRAGRWKRRGEEKKRKEEKKKEQVRMKEVK